MYCKNCGKEINSNDKFCKYCGTKNDDFCEDIESKNKPEVDIIKKTNKKERHTIEAILLGLFLNIIGVLIFHKLYPNNNKDYNISIISVVVINTIILVALFITFIVLFFK